MIKVTPYTVLQLEYLEPKHLYQNAIEAEKRTFEFPFPETCEECRFARLDTLADNGFFLCWCYPDAICSKSETCRSFEWPRGRRATLPYVYKSKHKTVTLEEWSKGWGLQYDQI